MLIGETVPLERDGRRHESIGAKEKVRVAEHEMCRCEGRVEFDYTLKVADGLLHSLLIEATAGVQPLQIQCVSIRITQRRSGYDILFHFELQRLRKRDSDLVLHL